MDPGGGGREPLRLTRKFRAAGRPGPGEPCQGWKVPFRARTRAAEPRVEATLRPGTFDPLRNYEGRSNCIKGPVTIVGATAHQEVLIAVTG